MSQPLGDNGSGSLAPGNDGGGNGNAGVIVVAVVVPVVLIGAIILALWCYRRKTGRWPKPWRRDNMPPIHQNPFGSKTYASRWQTAATTPPKEPVGDGGQANFRPIPPGNKRYNSITERISSHLHEASEKLSKQQQNFAEHGGPVRSVSKDVGRASLRTSSDTAAKNAADLQRSCRSYDGELGVYQDRTLPATLMMTSESKRQKFANEVKALKRFNSATLRSSTIGKGSRNPNKSRRCDSGRMQVFNDFGSNSNMSQYRNNGKPRRTSNISSFVSSKPSITSDYVSDLETGLTDRTIKNQRLSNTLQAGQKNLYSGSESTFQGSVINTSNGLDSKLLFEVNQSSNIRFSHQEAVGRIKGKLQEAQQLCIDDRTESQQNTMRSEVFYRQQILEEERSTIECQSSDTESMAESAYTAGTRENSFRSKRRQYNSDNEFLSRGSSRRNRTKRKQCHRSRSDGWDSEPSMSGSQKRSQSRNPSQSRTRRQRGFVNYGYEGRGSIEKLKMPQPQPRRETNNSNLDDVIPTNPPSPGYLKVLPTFESSSFKPPKIGTVMEMPIYSQSTWSGPGAVKHKKNNNRKPKISKSTIGHSRNPPKVRKHTKAGRKLSIGGGGRYFCEYGSLPVDISKLPKDLVDKLGGKTDKLLEPIDKLNFDMLTKPLPNLGKTESQNSARRRVVDRLPPNHQDREIFKNTYEDDTGLVTTDL